MPWTQNNGAVHAHSNRVLKGEQVQVETRSRSHIMPEQFAEFAAAILFARAENRGIVVPLD